MRKRQRVQGKGKTGSASAPSGMDVEDFVVETFLDELALRTSNLEEAAERCVAEIKESSKFTVERSLLNPLALLISSNEPITLADITSGAYLNKRDEIMRQIGSLLNAADIKHVSLRFCLPESAIPQRKLAPSKGVLRSKASTFEEAPTPFLNSLILEDMLRKSFEHRVSEAVKACSALEDAFALTRDWVDRNQPSDMMGKFPAEILCLMLSELVLTPESGQIWCNAKPFQLFKRTLRWLSESDLVDADGQIGLKANRVCARLGNESVVIDDFDIASFRDAFPIVVLDGSGALNLAHAVLPSSFALLRAQAKSALATDDEEGLLLWRLNSISRFDLLLRLDMPPRPPSSKSANYYSAAKELHAVCEGSWEDYVHRRLDWLISKSLVGTGRAVGFGIFKLKNTQGIIIGLLLDPEKAFRLVDRGPPADEDVAAGQFRAFWGSRSELRRFKDGAIIEAVVWDDSNRREIPVKILEHLRTIHQPFDRLPETSVVRVIGSELLNEYQIEHEDEQSRQAIVFVQQLERQIRAVEGLALKISDMAVVSSPALRYTGFVAKKHALAYSSRDTIESTPSSSSSKHPTNRLVPLTAELVLKFEGSSKWPDSAEARKLLESVLLSDLAAKLEDMDQSNANQLAEEASPTSPIIPVCVVTSQAYMDVMARGWAVRVRPYRKEDEPSARLQSLIHALHHRAELGASRSLGMCGRLARRWISGQRFSTLLPDDVVDTLVASLFLQPFPAHPPKAPLAFLLRFVDLIASFDWPLRPLFVDLVNVTPPSKSTKSKADKAFFELRSGGRAPPMVLFVRLRADDKEEDVFKPFMQTALMASLTDDALAEIVKRAKDTKKLLIRLCELEAEGKETSVAMWRSVFASDVNAGFDAVLELGDLDHVFSIAAKADMAKYHNLMSMASRQALIGLNPVQQVVTELQTHFGRVAEFFVGSSFVPHKSGTTSTATIGIKWRSDLKHGTSFKLATAKYCSPMNGEPNRVELNFSEILDEMCRVGRGVISGARLASASSL